MKSIDLKYGNSELNILVPQENLLGILQSKDVIDIGTEQDVILHALRNPIGSERLCDLVKAGESICIIISDITRSWQKMDLYLPYIVEELNEAGIKDADITFLCATGSHRGQAKEEHELLLGEELYNRFEVIDHDCNDVQNLVYLGTTSFGTPVSINKKALDCNHIILTGAIVFHDLAGWSGGKKSILPGISAYESIMANHKLSLNPADGGGINPLVRCGNIEANPVHLDMLEAAAFVKPTFLFNVIIGENGEIVKAVSGDYIEAHEIGRNMVNEIDSVYIQEKADMVIASAGGYPKDIELYQASKALINAKEAVKPGGLILLLAECREGFGAEGVKSIIEGYNDNPSREAALREDYTIARYTGYLIAKIAEAFNVILVTSMDAGLLSNTDIRVVSSVKEALNFVGQEEIQRMKVYVMPAGANTLPRENALVV